MTTAVGPTGYQIRLVDLSDQANIQTAINEVVFGSSTAPSTVGGINATSIFGTLAPKASPAFTGSATFAGGLSAATSIDGSTTSFSAFASPTTLTLGYSGVSTHTANINTGITASGQTKTINIGTNGATGSTTSISIGPASSSLTSNINLNGKVKLNTQSLTTAVSGTVEYDNRVFYSTTGGANRGLIPSTHYYTWTGSNYSFNTLAANNGYPAINLVSGTAYEVEILYMMAANTAGATSTTVFGMGGTSTWTYDYYQLDYGTSTTSMLGASATLVTLYQTMSASTTIGASSTSTRYYVIKYKGTVRCTGSGTFYLYVNGSAVTSNTIYPGSYIKITPTMQRSATTVGTWV